MVVVDVVVVVVDLVELLLVVYIFGHGGVGLKGGLKINIIIKLIKLFSRFREYCKNAKRCSTALKSPIFQLFYCKELL